MDEDKELISEVSKKTIKVHIGALGLPPGPGGESHDEPRDKGPCLSPDFMLELIPILAKAQKRAAQLAGEKG